MLDKFGLTLSQLSSLVAEGLRGGGNWCDLYFENTETFDLILRDGAVTSGEAGADYGCGVRVLSGEKTGYAYAETTSYKALLDAARSAAAIADGPAVTSLPYRSAKAVPARDVYSQKRDWRNTEASEFVPVLEGLDREIRRRDPRVLKVIAVLSWSVSEVMMYNSLGELACDTRPLGSIAATVVFAQGDKIENQYVSRSFRCGAEMIGEAVIDELATLAVRDIDARFDARRPKGGRMPVVMGAGASGILLHEAMGHAFEADFCRKGQSVFEGRLGKRVAARGINIIDDGTLEGNRGSCLYDDEAVPGQKTYMVCDGVLTSYLHDRISASFYGVEPTGNGRRESFRYNPIPRMRATYMDAGTDGTLEDLLHRAGNGIYVDQFANGQVKIGEGDFTFYVKSGYLIENGRLTMPVKDINIIGNGPAALSDIAAVAGDATIDNGTWTCGKEQSVPVGCGIPSVLVNNLTVGGE